jgi:capsular polysaccharide biosynthesis protein
MNLKHLFKKLLLDFLRKSSFLVNLTDIPKGEIKLMNLNKNKFELKCIEFLQSRLTPICLPIHLEDKLHWKFEKIKSVHPDRNFIIEAHNWYVWGNQGCVITDDHLVITDVSREFCNKTHSVFFQIKLKKPTFMAGRIAVVAASGSDVYYHWMVDVLPRVQLLVENNLMQHIDKIIINYQGLSFQKESLAKLGICEEKLLINNNHWSFHTKHETLIIPSLVSPNDIVSKYAIAFLRKTFLKPSNEANFSHKIYIKRIKTRRILNENEFESVLFKLGFISINLENLTLEAQAMLFYNADFIIGPHGAGFTNIVFCKAGTKVIDIFSPNWVNPCYWTIAHELKLKYAYLIGEGKRPNDFDDPQKKADDILVDINKLELLIEKLSN